MEINPDKKIKGNFYLFIYYLVGTLLLEPHSQSILQWLFWGWSLINYFLPACLEP
jgi:hypothetical protein